MEDFFSRVDRFNDSVSAEWLTQGFETAGITETKYDPYEMQDLWTEKNRAFPGYNCRITAMSLFGEFLSFGEDTDFDAGEDVLFVDEETLKADPGGAGREQSERFPRAVCLHESGGQHGGRASVRGEQRLRAPTILLYDKAINRSSENSGSCGISLV